MDFGILIGAALTCAVGGILPWINAEVVVVGAALLLPPAGLPALVLACAVGQMSSKSAVYAASRWMPECLPERARKLLARAERYRERRVLLATAVFSGALAALPPFYLVTLASGMLRVPFPVFLVAGLSGTAARYGLLAGVACALGAASCALR